MTATNSTPSAPNGEKPEPLGKLLFKCRPRTVREYFVACGVPWGLFVIFFPGILFGCSMALPAMPVLFLEPYWPQWALRAFWAVSFVGVMSLFLWQLFIYPNGDYVHAYQKGFRIRRDWRRFVARFDQLAQIHSGRKPGLIMTVSQIRALFNKPESTNWAKYLNQTALTMRFRDGRVKVCKTFFIRFQQADMEQFAQYIID